MAKWSDDEMEAFIVAITKAWNVCGKSLAPEMAIAIGEYLQDNISAEEAIAGIKKTIDTKGKPPTAPDILHTTTGNPKEFGKRAWQVVLDALARVGTYQSITFRDPIINAVLADLLGTWEAIRKYDDGGDGLTWLGKDFERLYNDYVNRRTIPAVSHLPGTHELENKRRGFDSPEPVAFGPQPPIKALTITSPTSLPEATKDMLQLASGAVEARTL